MRGSRKLDMSGARQALKDRRYWVGIGIVYEPSGETHYEIDDDVGVLVNVKLMPEEEPLLARLGGFGEGGTNGVWRIPPVGSEVVIAVPGGDIGGDTVLLAVLASGDTPDELDADTVVIKGPSTVMIIGAEVKIQSEGGSPEPLITKTIFDAHIHGTGVGPSAPPNNAASSGTSIIKGH